MPTAISLSLFLTRLLELFHQRFNRLLRPLLVSLLLVRCLLVAQQALDGGRLGEAGREDALHHGAEAARAGRGGARGRALVVGPPGAGKRRHAT